jgi:hypothetical protein
MMFSSQMYYPGQRMRSNCKERQGKDCETTSDDDRKATLQPTQRQQLLQATLKQLIMSLESAKSVLNILNAKVEAGDVEGGKAALAEMKVSS